MPIASFPKSGSVIKPSKRNLPSVLAAVNQVNMTAHKAAIAILGGVNAVATVIWAAISVLAAASCTIMAVMMQMMQSMQMMQMMMMMQMMEHYQQQAAVYAVLTKLV